MKIAAVVVTFNRLRLLKESIDSIRIQTYKVDEIIVVNNSSTDGTMEWLNEQNDLTTITQENLGGAGGFYTGIKYAYEKGYDWIWCMDDDGQLETGALQKLIPYLYDEKEIKIFNCLVVSKEDNNKLSFGLYDETKDEYIDKLELLRNELFVGSVNFFNGTIIPKEFIKKFGLPIRTLFMKGDDLEYALRAIYNKIGVFSITSSRIYHPGEKHILINNFFFKYKFSFLNKIKRYYSIRNMIILKRMYYKEKQESIIKRIFLDSIFILICEKSISNLLILFKGVIDGVKMDLREIYY